VREAEGRRVSAPGQAPEALIRIARSPAGAASYLAAHFETNLPGRRRAQTK